MPNHVYNSLIVKGEKKEIKKFREENKQSPDEPLDFNNCVQEPAELLQYQPFGDKKNKSLIKKYGADNWYAWRVKNWGTKWNAYNADIRDYDKKGNLLITFETAWSPPIEWLKSLAKKYPKLSFTLYFEEEAKMYPDGKIEAKGRKFKEYQKLDKYHLVK